MHLQSQIKVSPIDFSVIMVLSVNIRRILELLLSIHDFDFPEYLSDYNFDHSPGRNSHETRNLFVKVRLFNLLFPTPHLFSLFNLFQTKTRSILVYSFIFTGITSVSPVLCKKKGLSSILLLDLAFLVSCLSYLTHRR